MPGGSLRLLEEGLFGVFIASSIRGFILQKDVSSRQIRTLNEAGSIKP
jgi:hypothetical protein